MRLPGRRALVTGAGGVLGRASALRFASEGAGVAVLDVDAEAAEETARLVRSAGGHAYAVTADVRDEDQVVAAVAHAAHNLGGLDLLFNNAGVMPHQDISFLDADPVLWGTIHDINLLGTRCAASMSCPTCSLPAAARWST